ncbi:MAG: hypothetical protein JW776_13500 [Candidatus Lokiarchaeota archaeon]|nr:hypothetical protein [Candidatus Lokiarchaeota archaeon]
MVKKENMAAITITSLVIYVVFITLAILLYTGGIKTDLLKIKYSFWGNSLSDLGMITGYNGLSNLYSMVLFTIGTSMLGLSFIPFSLSFPELFNENRVSWILAFIGSILGYLVAAGMIGIAFTPHTTFPTIHMISVYIAYASLFFSTVLYSIAIFIYKKIHNVYGIIAALFSVIFLGTLIMGLFGLDGMTNIMEISQKVGRGLTIITYIVLSIPLLKE